MDQLAFVGLETAAADEIRGPGRTPRSIELDTSKYRAFCLAEALGASGGDGGADLRQPLFSGHVFERPRLRVGPGREIVDLAIEMAVDDLGERAGEIGLRIDAAELAGLDERGDDRPVFSAAVGTGEERVLAVESDRANGTFVGVGVDLDAAVVEESRRALPARQRVADRLGELGLLADQRQPFAQPRFEIGERRSAPVMAGGAPKLA
jgi:hypothetical protein